jgi:hypothetical protein
LKSTDGLLAKQARGEHSAGQSKKAQAGWPGANHSGSNHL